MKYDVIILGAGPAGTAAAVTCSKAGLNVAVITQVAIGEVPDPTPVQSIHPGVVSLLQALDLEPTLENSTRAQFDAIVVNGEANPLNPNGGEPWYGHHLDRRLWDQALLQHLESLPIALYSDTSIHKVTRGADASVEVIVDEDLILRCRYLIDASGARRITRHFLKLDEIFLTRPMTCWTGRSFGKHGNGSRTEFSMHDAGWTWIAPEDERHLTWSTLQLDGKAKGNAPVPEFESIGKPYAYNVRWRVFRPICDQQVLLCGDAAGILDPAAGQGILNALMSGIKAGECLMACIAEPKQEAWHFAMYDQWFISQYEQKVEDLAKYYQKAGINILLRDQENTVNT